MGRRGEARLFSRGFTPSASRRTSYTIALALSEVEALQRCDRPDISRADMFTRFPILVLYHRSNTWSSLSMSKGRMLDFRYASPRS